MEHFATNRHRHETKFCIARHGFLLKNRPAPSILNLRGYNPEHSTIDAFSDQRKGKVGYRQFDQ